MARRRRTPKSNPLVLLIFLVGATIVIGSLCVFTSSKQPTATQVVVPTVIPPTPTQQMEPSGAGDILLASAISGILSTILTVIICVRIYHVQVVRIFYRLDNIDRLVAALRRSRRGG